MRAKQRHGLIAVLGENSKDLGNALVRPPPREARRLGNCITDHGIIGKKRGLSVELGNQASKSPPIPWDLRLVAPVFVAELTFQIALFA